MKGNGRNTSGKLYRKNEEKSKKSYQILLDIIKHTLKNSPHRTGRTTGTPQIGFAHVWSDTVGGAKASPPNRALENEHKRTLIFYF